MEEITNVGLKSPTNFVISGATGSGKTCFLLKMLKHWPFEQQKKIGKMMYFYNIWQPLFEQFLATFPTMTFVQGLQEMVDADWPISDDTINICICDDLADHATKSETFARLFTVYGHHKNIVNFFITQNPFFKGPYSTTINRNTHYFVLTKTPHLNVLDTLGSQLYGSSGPLKTAYLKCMKEKPYNYILIDVFNDSVDIQLRFNIFPDKFPMIIWRHLQC